MKEKRDIFDNIKGPRDALKALTAIVGLIWFTIPVAFGFLVYAIVMRILRVQLRAVVTVGIIIILITFLHEWYLVGYNGHAVFANGFWANMEFWKDVLRGYTGDAFSLLFSNHGIDYLIGSASFITVLWALFDLIPNNAHEKELMAIHRAQAGKSKEANIAKTQKVLNELRDENYNGVLLGVSKYSGTPVVLPDNFVNQVVLVLGTTGAGKTVTLRRFYSRATLKNYPLIIIDGKPTDESVAWVQEMAHRCERNFYGFNCNNFYHYDPLAEGGYTELKDKIISLKDQWESDYYRSIAEDYLQTAFEILLKSKQSYDLKRVVECLDFSELSLLTRNIQDEQLEKRVRRLEGYDRKDITGLQAHLNILIHSELGKYFEIIEKNTFNLKQVINEKAVVYFALPALRYPSFSKVLGKLIINDIKAVVDRNTQQEKIFTCFDEFSVFAGEQVLNLVNMGRSKGVHAVLGTQGLADLKKVDKNFAGQVLNCANTIICHRLNDQESAEDVASWVGTKDTFNLTAQIDARGAGSSTGLGSVRRVKEFIVHPDDIKQNLPVGEAFFISKVGGFYQDKIKIKIS
jgi:GTPase SAR1 family protein